MKKLKIGMMTLTGVLMILGSIFLVMGVIILSISASVSAERKMIKYEYQLIRQEGEDMYAQSKEHIDANYDSDVEYIELVYADDLEQLGVELNSLALEYEADLQDLKNEYNDILKEVEIQEEIDLIELGVLRQERLSNAFVQGQMPAEGSINLNPTKLTPQANLIICGGVFLFFGGTLIFLLKKKIIKFGDEEKANKEELVEE